MSSNYHLAAEDFEADLDAITALVQTAHKPGVSARTRVASINAGTLLLASTFEEFIREMGRLFARDFVLRLVDPKKIPRKLTAAAWKRTLEHLIRVKIDTGGTPLSLEHISADSRAKFNAALAFLDGDISQDIYGVLIHNDYNMRPDEINKIFSICGISDICLKICADEGMKQHFDCDDSDKTKEKFSKALNDFMEVRNGIAHALNAGQSLGPDSFLAYITEFRAIALALTNLLPNLLPNAPADGQEAH